MNFCHTKEGKNVHKFSLFEKKSGKKIKNNICQNFLKHQIVFPNIFRPFANEIMTWNRISVFSVQCIFHPFLLISIICFISLICFISFALILTRVFLCLHLVFHSKKNYESYFFVFRWMQKFCNHSLLITTT